MTHLTAIFHDKPAKSVPECHRSGSYWSKEADGGDVVTAGAIKTCRAPVKSSPPTYHHPTFYRPSSLPVTQPTEHWREKRFVRPKLVNIIFWHSLIIFERIASLLRLWLWLLYEIQHSSRAYIGLGDRVHDAMWPCVHVLCRRILRPATFAHSFITAEIRSKFVGSKSTYSVVRLCRAFGGATTSPESCHWSKHTMDARCDC